MLKICCLFICVLAVFAMPPTDESGRMNNKYVHPPPGHPQGWTKILCATPETCVNNATHCCSIQPIDTRTGQRIRSITSDPYVYGQMYEAIDPEDIMYSLSTSTIEDVENDAGFATYEKLFAGCEEVGLVPTYYSLLGLVPSLFAPHTAAMCTKSEYGLAAEWVMYIDFDGIVMPLHVIPDFMCAPVCTAAECQAADDTCDDDTVPGLNCASDCDTVAECLTIQCQTECGMTCCAIISPSVGDGHCDSCFDVPFFD